MVKPNQADLLDDMVAPFSTPKTEAVKLETGFSAGKDDPLADLQLMRFEKYKPRNEVESITEFYGVVLSVVGKEKAASNQMNSGGFTLEPAVVVRARIPIIHGHLPAPRSTSDVALINMYPEFYAWSLDDIGGKIPLEGSIVKLAFSDPKSLGEIYGNGILKSVVHINPPGLAGPIFERTAFAGNLLDGTGELLKMCPDQRNSNDKSKPPKGQPIAPTPSSTLTVSPRNPRKLNSPHYTPAIGPVTAEEQASIGAQWATYQNNIDEIISYQRSPLARPQRAEDRTTVEEWVAVFRSAGIDPATQPLGELAALAGAGSDPEAVKRLIEGIKEDEENAKLAKMLGQPVPEPTAYKKAGEGLYFPSEPATFSSEQFLVDLALTIRGGGRLRQLAKDKAKDLAISALKSQGGSAETLGAAIEVVDNPLGAAADLAKSAISGRVSPTGFLAGIGATSEAKHNENARKALKRALAHQNKNRVGYGQNKTSATPPNKGMDCTQIYTLDEFASANLKEYRKNIEELEERGISQPRMEGLLLCILNCVQKHMTS